MNHSFTEENHRVDLENSRHLYIILNTFRSPTPFLSYSLPIHRELFTIRKKKEFKFDIKIFQQVS